LRTPTQLEVGVELSPLTKAPDRAQLVKFAAGGGDFNPLHFDPDFPQARDIGDNLVHGRLKYAALGQLLSDWLDHDGFVRRISASYRGMDRLGDTFTCHARIVGLREHDGSQIIQLELWTENAEGQRTTVGAAEVILTRSSTAARSKPYA
jgi:acyl dehydratase